MAATEQVETPDSARVIGPPPVICFGLLGMALIPHYAWRYVELFPEAWAGPPLLLVGTLILIWGVRTMRRSGVKHQSRYTDSFDRLQRPLRLQPQSLVSIDDFRLCRSHLNAEHGMTLVPIANYAGNSPIRRDSNGGAVPGKAVRRFLPGISSPGAALAVTLTMRPGKYSVKYVNACRW